MTMHRSRMNSLARRALDLQLLPLRRLPDLVRPERG